LPEQPSESPPARGSAAACSSGRTVRGSRSAHAGGSRFPTRQPEDGLSIFEEEIPREGIRVTRSYQLTRWQDGSTHLWIGRPDVVGSGEGSSGLQFDTAPPGHAPESPPPVARAGSSRDASLSIPGWCSSWLEPRPSRSR